ncbi:MAG: non-canonical purine NTP pyrophosphatase [Acidobacteria bacterium]|nr:non-canonical purine NTP pyrophosphatase [Acidobacteriota bacterium]
MTLLLATTSADKVREIRSILAGVDVDLLTLADVAPVPEPDETGASFWENARIKALAYAAATGLTAVAEDSGLVIDALDGAPGVHSARFLSPTAPYAERFAEIFRRLADHTPPFEARFVTALAVARGHRILFETEARVEGEITSTPAGAHGFGYDPIFRYPPFGVTTAEMTLAGKSAVSHRARAFRDLKRALPMIT